MRARRGAPRAAPYRIYDGGQCIAYYAPYEHAAVSSNSLWVYTYFMQKYYDRVCASTGATAPPVNVTAFPFYMTYASNCTSVNKARGGAFLVAAENVGVVIRPTYVTSWGASGTLTQLSVVDAKGKAVTTSAAYSSTTGELQLQLSDMLALAGVDLDTVNADSGGYGPASPASGNADWPSYRLTGLQLVASVSVTNLYTTNPANFNFSATVAFALSTAGEWHQPPTQVILDGPTSNVASLSHQLDQSYFTREWSGVEVQFVASGRVGRPEPFAIIAALLNVYVILSAMGALVDALGPSLSQDFAREKYDDGGERAALALLLEKVSDHGVPFNFEDLRLRQVTGDLGESYEDAIFRLEKEVEQLRFGNDKVRAAAKLLAAEVALDGDEILDEKVAAPEPVMKLMSPDGADEIPLFAGDNALGRGLGQCRHPTISRKQLVLSIDPDTQKAFVRGCRGDKANSVPGVKRGDNPWRPLTEKGQTLSQGDRIAMMYKKVMSRDEVTNEYIYAMLQQVPETKPTLFETLQRQLLGGGAAKPAAGPAGGQT